MPVRLADESFVSARQAVQTLLNVPAILSAVAITGADAVHPGVDFCQKMPILPKLLGAWADIYRTRAAPYPCHGR